MAQCKVGFNSFTQDYDALTKMLMAGYVKRYRLISIQRGTLNSSCTRKTYCTGDADAGLAQLHCLEVCCEANLKHNYLQIPEDKVL